MRLLFAERFSYQTLVALSFFQICSRAATITYCSPELAGASNSTTNIYMSNGYCSGICQDRSVFFVILGSDCWCSDYAPATQLLTSLCNTPCPGYPPDSCGNTTSNLYAYFNLGRRPSGTAVAFTAASIPVTSSITSNLATSDPLTASTFSTTTSSSSSPTAGASEATTSDPSTSATSVASTAGPSSFTSTDASDIALYLQTAIPASARSQSSNVCFVNTAFSYYSTPTWYQEWPTQVQSYYSSSAQGQTAACTLSASQLNTSAHRSSSGLSTGAKAGIAVGVILAVFLIAALLLFFCIRRRKRNRRASGITSDKTDLEHEKAALPSVAYANTNPHYVNTHSNYVNTQPNYPDTQPNYVDPHTNYVNTHPNYIPARSDDADFTALPAVPPSAHMQSTHPQYMSAVQGRHKDDSIQSTPSMSEISHLEQPPSKPWLNYANQPARSEMSEDQQFFPALQQQNPYQLDPELDFGTHNQYAVPHKRPVGGVGQGVHAGGISGGFGLSDNHNTGYESGGERSWYHAR